MSLLESRVFPVSSLVSIDSVPINLLCARRRSKNDSPPLREDARPPFFTSPIAEAHGPTESSSTALPSETNTRAADHQNEILETPRSTDGVGSVRPEAMACNTDSIQIFGAAIGLEENAEGNLLVSMSSDNSKAVLGYSTSELFALGDIAEILDEHESDVLLDHIASAHGRSQPSTPDIFDMSIQTPNGLTNYFSCAIHTDSKNPSLLLCEFEPQNVACPTCQCPHESQRRRSRRASTVASSHSASTCCHNHGRSSAMDTLSTMSKAHEKISTSSTTEVLLERFAKSIKTITGHQDISVYRFDKHWDSRIIAQSDDKEAYDYFPNFSGQVSFNLPLKYRKIFQNQKVQVQLDSQEETARLVGRNDEQPPVNNESLYLRVLPDFFMHDSDKEDIQSRVMIPLKVSGKLWGVLISNSPAKAPISFLSRGLCRLTADSAERRMEDLMNSWTLESRGPFSPHIGLGKRPALAFPAPRDLLSTLKADFAISIINGTKKLMGSAMAPQEGLALVEYLRLRQLTDNLTSDDFAADFPDLHYQPGFQSVSGLLFIPLSPDGEDFVVFFQEASSNHGNEAWSETDLQNAAIIRVVYWKFSSVWREKENALQESRLCRLLMSNSSHEFRTLLNAITNYLEFAEEGQMDAKVSDTVMMAKTTAQLLYGAVTKLLDCVEKELES